MGEEKIKEIVVAVAVAAEVVVVVVEFFRLILDLKMLTVRLEKTA
jgi:hypothetical protein